MNDNETPQQRRLRQIAESRSALAERYAADPDAVQRFEARKANIDAVRRRERQRVDHLVLGEKRPDPEIVRPAGLSRQQWKIEKKRLRDVGARLDDPEIEQRLQVKERWSHKKFGTPETWERDGLHSDALVQLEKNGTLDKEQIEWAAEIANVHRSIESDVSVNIASLEARVDESRGNGAGIAEGVRRVRLHLAYGLWRTSLPDPKQMILDMIVGDRIGYTVAATRYHVGNLKAKARLINALDIWPTYVDMAYRRWSNDEIAAANEAAGLYDRTGE